MPLYEYECNECGHRTEVLQGFSDPPPAECPQCGGPVRRLLSAPAVQFKGSGWYVTDYGGKNKSGGAGEKAKGSSDGEAKGESGGGDKKDAGEGASSATAKPSKSASGSGD